MLSFSRNYSQPCLSWASPKFLGQPLDTKKMCLTILLSCYQILEIFGVIGSELWIFDSRPRTLRHGFMRTRFEFQHILAPCVNGYRKCYPHEDQTYPLCSPKSCWRFESFSSGLCMQLSFIAVKIYPCACACIWFWQLSLIPDICLRIHDRWCTGMDSLELPRGGWFSCTFVGHPKGLWVHCVSRVLGTWAHDHRPTPSLRSEGEDPRVPDTSYMGRVGG
jgi:hypothetical protein